MKKQRKREEIEEQYTWDLTTIFKSDEEFLEELENAKKEIKKVENFRGKITLSASNLLSYLQFSDALERKLYKLFYYANLKFDSDTTNGESQKLKGKVDNLLKEESELSSFVNPELFSIPFAQVEEYMDENEELKSYHHTLESFYRTFPHKLNETEEKILSSLGNVLSTPEEAYECLTDSDMKFGMIEDEEGKEVELTESNYTNYIRSSDRMVRKKAFTRLFETYATFKNTIAKTFAGNVDYLTSMAKIRKFPSSLEASLFYDKIDPGVYHNLIETVHKHLPILYKYYDVKKRILNVDELHLYDIYVDLVEETDKEYSFEEAKTTVLEALQVLGDDYVNTFKRAFEERWIDVYNNVGKRGGAYSSGFYDTNPFILLNYEGKLRDVSTLAHEGGHSMHTYLSCKNNPYHDSHYKIFVAEVASTVNELLLLKHLYKKEKDDKQKLAILNEIMELFKSTIYRQVMFAEFEKEVHALKEQGEVLTNELLSKEYYRLNKKYFGNNVVVDELIAYEWERIPHFYYNFYVYKYAIGLSSACYIVNNILNGKEGALESYLNFLKSGGSDYPTEELKLAGVDILSSEIIESAIEMFDETIDEFEALYKKVYA